MKAFDYNAVDSGGQAVRGRTFAKSELDLDRDLEASGLTLVSSTSVSNGGSRRSSKMPPDELVSFTTQLSTVLSAGVPIVQCLDDLGLRMRNEGSRWVTQELVTDLKAGRGLSDAMDQQPRSFPEIYRASVRAGEVSGSLSTVLTRLSTYLDWKRSMRATTVQALIYPAILFVAILGLVVTLLTFVLPKIIGLFPGGREDLPIQTRIVMDLSDFLTGNAIAISIVVVVGVIAFLRSQKTEKGRNFLGHVILKVPRLGEVARMLATSKFASTAATLHNAGCDVYTVLNVAGSTCGNAYMANAFSRVSANVHSGLMISESLEREPIMDPLLLQMVAVGEQSGDLGGCLDKLAAYYDQEVPRTVKWFLSLLEPLMLICAGGVVAFIIVAALMPIFSLYDNLG